MISHLKTKQPGKRKYTKSGKERKKHVVKRQNPITIRHNTDSAMIAALTSSVALI